MKRSRVWALLAAVVVAGALYDVLARSPAPQSAPNPSVLVETIQLAPGALPAVVTGYGSVRPGPGAQRDLALGGGGIVSQFLVGPGERVAADAALAQIRPDPLSVAELRKAQGGLTAARANAAHIAALLSAHLATRADLAAAEQGVQDATATLAALRANGTGVARTLRAPQAGIVAALLVQPGTPQPAGTAILRFVAASGLVAAIGLPPDQAAAVRPGDTAKLTLLESGVSQNVQVNAVGAMLDPQTGLTPIRLSLGAGATLGAPLAAAITTGRISGYVVPRDAVQSDAQGDYVFQVDRQHVAQREAVRVLGVLGQQTVIAQTLDPALPLVTQGNYQLSDGMSVREQKAGGTGP
jgi:RND family efflux transporter MFP subunit